MRQLSKSRRDVLTAAITTTLINAVCTNAHAAAQPEAAAAWLRRMIELKQALIAGEITVLDWQREAEACGRAVPVHDIQKWLDVDLLTRRFHYSSRLANYMDPLLPTDIAGPRGFEHGFFRLFAMRRGGGLLPHIHNNMVSAHLVISGQFHIVTHDRLEDIEDAVVLRCRRDEIVGPGEIITMSDQSENQHWLRAQQDRSMTLDVAVLDVPASWQYRHAASDLHTVLVDPRDQPGRDGCIVAPVISAAEAVARFAN